MAADEEFRRLVSRVRQGCPDAAAELLKLYEPEIRRVIRIRLSDSRVRQVVDSIDICQSVMANFFVRAAAGQFDLDEPTQLVKLLAQMARNKVLDQVRRQQAGRRDRRREQGGGDGVLEGIAGSDGTPSQIVAHRELLQEVRRRLTSEERYLAEQREQGREWAELAVELGKGAEALRKQLTRGMDRVAQELGLDGADHA
jgi:RNA polymerase sigma-70 factor (ECF subfamily)